MHCLAGGKHYVGSVCSTFLGRLVRKSSITGRCPAPGKLGIETRRGPLIGLRWAGIPPVGPREMLDLHRACPRISLRTGRLRWRTTSDILRYKRAWLGGLGWFIGVSREEMRASKLRTSCEPAASTCTSAAPRPARRPPKAANLLDEGLLARTRTQLVRTSLVTPTNRP